MADICNYKIIAKGKKNACFAFIHSMNRYDDFEIIEEMSGASFGIYNNKDIVQEDLLEKEVVALSSQYVDGKRLIIIKF